MQGTRHKYGLFILLCVIVLGALTIGAALIIKITGAQMPIRHEIAPHMDQPEINLHLPLASSITKQPSQVTTDSKKRDSLFDASRLRQTEPIHLSKQLKNIRKTKSAKWYQTKNEDGTMCLSYTAPYPHHLVLTYHMYRNGKRIENGRTRLGIIKPSRNPTKPQTLMLATRYERDRLSLFCSYDLGSLKLDVSRRIPRLAVTDDSSKLYCACGFKLFSNILLRKNIEVPCLFYLIVDQTDTVIPPSSGYDLTAEKVISHSLAAIIIYATIESDEK
jgi:hypothetical protein